MAGTYPGRGSVVNQAELALSAYSRRYLRDRVSGGRLELIAHIEQALEEYNQLYAHPFTWSVSLGMRCISGTVNGLQQWCASEGSGRHFGPVGHEVSGSCGFLRFHDLRHTAGSYLVALGVDPNTVSKILGHHSVTMTLGVYTHDAGTGDAAKRDAVKRLEATLGLGTNGAAAGD